ncbi:hypothetical protein Amsp01_100690 [Amycolatopsis sp. NBRC 101858]|nr:hypothetical protein Amsp01_100690 [Amycolatopsis sp. NBRC 101858]
MLAAAGGADVTGAGGLATAVENGAAATGCGVCGSSDVQAPSVHAKTVPHTAVAVRRIPPA